MDDFGMDNNKIRPPNNEAVRFGFISFCILTNTVFLKTQYLTALESNRHWAVWELNLIASVPFRIVTPM